MKRFIFFAVVFVAIFAFTSCKPTNIAEIEGTYLGIYSVTNSSSSSNFKLELKNGKFSILKLLHNQSEFSGNYSVNDDKIIFEIKVWETDYVDKDGNIIAYDFDTRIVPQGEYIYTFDGNKLKFSKTYDDNSHYEWELIKN